MVKVRKKTAKALIFCFSFHKDMPKPNVYTAMINRAMMMTVFNRIVHLTVYLRLYQNQQFQFLALPKCLL